MSVSQKPKPRHQRPSRAVATSVLKKFDCASVIYNFEISIDAFDVKAFAEDTGLEEGDDWTVVLPSDSRLSGYHVHFRGSIGKKFVHAGIEYWDLPVKRNKHHPEPSSESVMRWFGKFVRGPNPRGIVVARFDKPVDTWKSRFNLPFKVTMGDVEVVIDGLSLALPKNTFRAVNGWITRLGRSLFVTVDFVRPVDFSKFNLGADVALFNEAIKIFVEQTT